MTAIGRILRKIRIDNDELMYEMAQRLSISTAFLSAIETGRKCASQSLADTIIREYNLMPHEAKELREAAREGVKLIRIPLYETSSVQKDLALTFARHFERIDEETADRILVILNEREEVYA